MQMPCPRFSPGEGSKQSQVSALPERRVKKQRWTALLGYFEHLRMLFFVGRADSQLNPSGPARMGWIFYGQIPFP